MPLQYIGTGRIKRIHVDRRVMAHNRKTGGTAPAITVQLSSGALKARKVTVLGHSEMVQAGPVYSEMDNTLICTIKPLSCGARVWLETGGAVEVIT